MGEYVSGRSLKEIKVSYLDGKRLCIAIHYDVWDIVISSEVVNQLISDCCACSALQPVMDNKLFIHQLVGWWFTDEDVNFQEVNNPSCKIY